MEAHLKVQILPNRLSQSAEWSTSSNNLTLVRWLKQRIDSRLRQSFVHGRTCSGHPWKLAGARRKRVDAHGTSPWAEGPRVKPGQDDRVNLAFESEH